jgi:hypothetical protein
VNARADDDALSWDGDDDPTLDVGAAARERSAAPTPSEPDEHESAVPLADGFTAVGKGAERVVPASEEESPEAADEAGPVSMGNAALIAIGVLGGIYLLYTVGWIIGGLRLQGSAGFLVDVNGNASPAWVIGNGVALVLAALAPAVWFAVVYATTRRSRPWLRWTLLGLGVVLLVPWPLLMGGVAG